MTVEACALLANKRDVYPEIAAFSLVSGFSTGIYSRELAVQLHA
jgi:hypothetical protein